MPPPAGSSPLAWGTALQSAGEYAVGRIIPARVGNGAGYASQPSRTTDHPRSRGERPLGGLEDFPDLGSSPLAWGTAGQRGRTGARRRIIPARVGNGVRRVRHSPRQSGSSPLAWGTVVDRQRGDRARRIIPARVGNGCRSSSRRRACPDHPRSRGERAARQQRLDYLDGSSPLAWGTGRPGCRLLSSRRIIPARVGNGNPRPSGCYATPDHPRSRGERPPTASPPLAETGSSPLAWGTGVAGEVYQGRDFGSSPLAWGTAPAFRACCARSSDHPRSRGERGVTFSLTMLRDGSSPLAWGTGDQGRSRGNGKRIIPARVGNGIASPAQIASASDHPRSRGERVKFGPIEIASFGSSPLAWGTGHPRRLWIDDRRIIPARVGNGNRHLGQLAVLQDHPRSRGERSGPSLNPHTTCGSSPLAWGTGPRASRRCGGRRIIPARVGNGSRGERFAQGAADHPRSRGERQRPRKRTSCKIGSSPLAWGTAGTGSSAPSSCRIIPARVGNGQARPIRHTFQPDHPRSRGERRVPGSTVALADGSSPLAWGTVQLLPVDPREKRIIPARVGNGARVA